MGRSDKNIGYGCKYGKNCTKFNPTNIEEASRLRRIMMNLNDNDLFSWYLIPELFRLFKQEHNNISKLIDYTQLNEKWKNHFKEYIIVRVSCNNGQLYKQGYEYYNNLTNQHNMVRNYDTPISTDSTFYYNYDDKEDFVTTEDNKPIKSYMAKMYAEEVTQVNKVSNKSVQVDAGSTGSNAAKYKSAYIVVRAKNTYTAKSFTFSAAEFERVKKAINEGSLTCKCKTVSTKINSTDPSASHDKLISDLMQYQKCKCGEYHINTAAMDQWRMAIRNFKTSNGYIYYDKDTTQIGNDKAYLANKDGSKIATNGAPGWSEGSSTNNTGGSSSGSTGGDSSSSTDGGGGTASTGGSTTSSTVNPSYIDYGDPGMYGGSTDGTTKDLAMYIRNNADTSTSGNTGKNTVSETTNADKALKASKSIANQDTTTNIISNNDNTVGTGRVMNLDTKAHMAMTGGINGASNPEMLNKTNAEVQQSVNDQLSGNTSSTGSSSSGGIGGWISTLSMSDVENAVKSVGKSAYGDSMDSLPEITFVPGMPDSDTSHKTSIMGIPMMYNSMCDPSGRVFSETTMMDLPLVFIQPGQGVINNTLDDTLMDELKDAYKDKDTGGAIKTTGMYDDLRALSFQDAFLEFIDYFQNVCSIVYGNLGLGVFNWASAVNAEQNVFKAFKNGKGTKTNIWSNKNLVFFADTASSVSDSFSNEFSDAPITSSVNNFGVIMRNIRMLSRKDASQLAFDDLSTSTLGAVADASSGGLTGLINELLSKGATLWNGSQLMFPQVWNDSRHDRSYNLSFKFFSPYGNKESIFQKVYMPLLALMTLTLPRMDSISGYAQPFYVRVNSPGY